MLSRFPGCVSPPVGPNENPCRDGALLPPGSCCAWIAEAILRPLMEGICGGGSVEEAHVVNDERVCVDWGVEESRSE